MAVLIREINMPKNCLRCKFIRGDALDTGRFEQWCGVNGYIIEDLFKRGDYCPMEETEVEDEEQNKVC